MATRRMKMTGFARFFIVMLFLVPLAYLGAAYYNGQDGIQNIKNLFGMDRKKPATEQVQVNPNTSQTVRDNANSAETNTNSGGSLDSRRLDQLELRMNQLERDNARLREQIRQQDLKIKELQQ